MNKEVIYVRIDEDLKKTLDMLALEEQRSLNNLVVRILSRYVEQKKKDTVKQQSLSPKGFLNFLK